ncbi:hypothetical protein DH2020_025995 [Rehmannia glutinosa]|uniref:Glycosyltransferases n=1 Tax=Rehmannia glutinosa TaxID=99300 RepID=A0ABR0VYX4_REHGL
MGSSERPRKKVHIWKKAIVHFLLCFVMGFFTGFAPTSKPSIFSSSVTMSMTSSSYSPQPVEVFHQEKTNRSLSDESESKNKETIIPEDEKIETEESNVRRRRLVIVVTPTSVRNKLLRGVLLRRLANTLKLVAQPLLWIVVEQKSDDDSKVSEILRKTGIMYRHVVFKENFTDVSSEMDYQRNIALNHIEQHKLSGIVHFAGLSNVYDLSFFEEIRAVDSPLPEPLTATRAIPSDSPASKRPDLRTPSPETSSRALTRHLFSGAAFGTWPIAKLSANRKRVIIEGPVCDSSEVVGWHLKRMNNLTDTTPPLLHISSFAFNSSILWDPERWGRTPSVQDTSQNSLRFVRKEVLEEETKLKGIPAQDCSKVLLWDLKISKEQ